MRVRLLVLLTTLVLGSGLVPALAFADVPVGPARYVPCPGRTGDARSYRGPTAPYRCHSAVRDPLGNVIILRQGRSAARPGAFGWLHATIDHNVDDHVIERITSSSYPRTAPRGRVRYSAELRVSRNSVMTVYIEVDPTPSNEAPDDERFGVVTAYCKLPRNADAENKCPYWVNDSLLP
jgi:hypothetical protein